jgi:hypothetical protein
MSDFTATHMGLIVGSVFGVIVLLIVLGVSAALRAAKRRKANLREWAFRNGFDFAEGPMPARELAPIAPFELDDKTTTADARNVTRGSRGAYVTLFDFDHTSRTRSGPHGNRTQSQTKTTSCALFKLDEPLPHFDFGAMGVASADSFQGKLMAAALALAKRVGPERGQMIELDDRPGFLLRTEDDPAKVKPLFADVHFFDDKTGWTVLSQGSWLLLMCDPNLYQHGWERGSIVNEKNYDEFVSVATKIHDHFRTGPQTWTGHWGQVVT